MSIQAHTFWIDTRQISPPGPGGRLEVRKRIACGGDVNKNREIPFTPNSPLTSLPTRETLTQTTSSLSYTDLQKDKGHSRQIYFETSAKNSNNQTNAKRLVPPETSPDRITKPRVNTNLHTARISELICEASAENQFPWSEIDIDWPHLLGTTMGAKMDNTTYQRAIHEAQDLRSRLKSLQDDPSEYARPSNIFMLPFPSLGEELPTARFDFKNKTFQYQGRIQFMDLYNRFVELFPGARRINVPNRAHSIRSVNGKKQLTINGVLGSGKSYMLAAVVACLYSSYYLVYLPDSMKLGDDFFYTVVQALILTFSNDNKILKRILACATVDDLRRLSCDIYQEGYQVVWICDQYNCLEREDAFASLPQQNRFLFATTWISKMFTNHGVVTAASANYKGFRATEHMQLHHEIETFEHGYSPEEMLSWWTQLDASGSCPISLSLNHVGFDLLLDVNRQTYERAYFSKIPTQSNDFEDVAELQEVDAYDDSDMSDTAVLPPEVEEVLNHRIETEDLFGRVPLLFRALRQGLMHEEDWESLRIKLVLSKEASETQLFVSRFLVEQRRSLTNDQWHLYCNLMQCVLTDAPVPFGGFLPNMLDYRFFYVDRTRHGHCTSNIAKHALITALRLYRSDLGARSQMFDALLIPQQTPATIGFLVEQIVISTIAQCGLQVANICDLKGPIECKELASDEIHINPELESCLYIPTTFNYPAIDALLVIVDNPGAAESRCTIFPIQITTSKTHSDSVGKFFDTNWRSLDSKLRQRFTGFDITFLWVSQHSYEMSDHVTPYRKRFRVPSSGIREAEIRPAYRVRWCPVASISSKLDSFLQRLDSSTFLDVNETVENRGRSRL